MWPWGEIVAACMVVLVFITTILSGVSDYRSLRIPNAHSLIVIGAFLIAFAAAPDLFGSVWVHLSSALLVFTVTYLMFHFNVMGAGDTKLASSLALWLGLKPLILFSFLIALAGGVLGVVALYVRRAKPFAAPREGSWIAQAQAGRSAVPYGIAIAVGFWVSFLHTAPIMINWMKMFQ